MPGPGLWANIHAKRKRIEAGSGERMRKPGEEGAPTRKDFKESAAEKLYGKDKEKKTKPCPHDAAASGPMPADKDEAKTNKTASLHERNHNGRKHSPCTALTWPRRA